MLLFPAVGLTATTPVESCGEGTGIPPFLSAGAKPNLLMVLDNSGSMLDAAYSKAGAYCFDDTYDSAKLNGYGGYFQNNQWYKWVVGDYQPWKRSTSYTAGTRVSVQGVIWELSLPSGTASATSSATATSPDDDSLNWNKIFTIPKWRNQQAYVVGDIVWSGPQLYKVTTAGTSNDSNAADGLNVAGDTGVVWQAVDSTWKNGKAYAAKSIVAYKGMLYQTTAGGTSNGTGVYDDIGVTWTRLNEGYFLAVEESAALAHCDSGDEKYIPTSSTPANSKDICLSLNNAVFPKQVAAFAAKGKFLNWAMASKFDVEKKILTGGKYNAKDKLLVSENRGCSGSRNIKQVQLPSTTTKYLSLGVRSSRYQDDPAFEDRIDSTDDTARLEILAVTATGYQMNQECKDAIDRILERGSLNGTQSQIDRCIATFPAGDSRLQDMRPVLNHSLQACWQDDPTTEVFEINKGKFKSLWQACQDLYKPITTGQGQRPGYPPYTLRPADGGPYICYGVYDSTIDHANRTGYLGRVWTSLGEGSSVTCTPWKPSDVPYTCPSGTLCYWKGTPSQPTPATVSTSPLYMNQGNVIYKCTGGWQANGSNAGQCSNNGWEQVYKDSNGGFHYDDDTCGISASSTTGANWENTTWTNIGNGGSDDDLITASDNGILQAIKDYCDDLRVPEVIDPSDSTGRTGTTGGLPGLLRDSELMAFMGGGQPIATMKGYIQQLTRPEGVVHKVSQDLRLGAMSFTYVGAQSECEQTTTNSKLERYCPVENKDGATLLTPLEWGYKDVASDAAYEGGIRRHVDDLTEQVNAIRGTSWTPLAEALYGALGYYTQNEKFCLNREKTCTKACTTTGGTAAAIATCKSSCTCVDTYLNGEDPVQFWCQDNHILLITEGESTADINASVAAFSVSPLSSSDPHLLSPTRPTTPTPCKCNPEHLQSDGTTCKPDSLAGDGDTNPSCTDGLYSSPYLDNMTWWGQNAWPLYKDRCVGSGQTRFEKKNIYTHVVTTGTLTAGDTGECSPITLMQNAAANGGTTNYYPGENPQQLEDNLYKVLDDILSRSSAGSAASVISSSRSGSGAVYQAVFWPKFEDNSTPKNKVSWVGDVHSLFVSSDGLMYEDTDQNGILKPTEDIDNDGTLDAGEDINGNGTLDAGEDLNGNGTLDAGEDLNENSTLDLGDKRVIFYFSDRAKKTRACYKPLNATTGQCTEPPATATDLVPACTATDSCVEIMNVKYLWSANKQLARMNGYNRKIFTWNDANNNGIVDKDSSNNEWFKLTELCSTADCKSNSDGSGSAKLANLNSVAAATLADTPADNNRGTVTKDFLSDDWEKFVSTQAGKTAAQNEQDALNALVTWLQGVDQLYDETVDDNSNQRLDKKLRPREFNSTTWRLGDIIHSTPIVVAKPAEAYHFIYRDPTYATFAAKWANRRNMVYFGGNDGMLHAMNGGFYFENGNQFCCTPVLKNDGTGTCDDSPGDGCGSNLVPGTASDAPELGEELWAYIPYNLQPHLKCLAEKFYSHKYFVDQKPRIFDAQIFMPEAACASSVTSADYKNNCVHPGGWGTILVGSMRFGGAPIVAKDTNTTTNTDTRKFISSFFILDITNPEADPVLLGEMTQQIATSGTTSGNEVHADLNYTTSSPSMIIMRDNAASSSSTEDNTKTAWYLVMGNGPTRLDGKNSDGTGKVAILPLGWLGGSVATWARGVPSSMNSDKKPFRIPNAEPTTGSSQGGIFSMPGTTASFVSDIISVDYNIDLKSAGDLGARYSTDAVYFGTVDGSDFFQYPSLVDQTYWNGGGRLFRLVTKEGSINSSTKEFVEAASTPSQWSGRWIASTTDTYSKGPVRLLADLKMPIVAAPSVGYDGYNYWIYAGTGRFYDDKDKTDDGWCTDDVTTCATRSKTAFFALREPLKDARSLSMFDGWNPPNGDLATCNDPIMTWGRIEWDITTQTNNGLQYNGIPGQRGIMRTDDILVEAKTDTNAGGQLHCYHCAMNASTTSYTCTSTTGCFPSTLPNTAGVYTFESLRKYIAGSTVDNSNVCQTVSGDLITTGLDGWYRDFHEPRERNLGTSALLGGLLTFTTYQPFNDKCQAEGESSLYGVHFQTGTAWIDTVFGTFEKELDSTRTGAEIIVKDKLSLGRGLSTTPSMHVGTGDQAAKAFIQTSTGEIIEVNQQNLPIKSGKSGRHNWTDRLGNTD
ncbi:hypothetical protein VU05_00225 [Desulfobulbus sp. F1]|nr:hypothetical protein [Desulfobulbus sp. F1]